MCGFPFLFFFEGGNKSNPQNMTFQRQFEMWILSQQADLFHVCVHGSEHSHTQAQNITLFCQSRACIYK